ncbi:HdeD family acid-resistance protein [Glycomyces luteolus]|uniref:HdeD family acid-resistance protein n=1 Tax=Glycomyces luteolus TaxID=2670330 RepID=A0A9X3SNJ7_9ACTN|nr:HdeD family acid-resistance protein [Glycomyces luteolus]MDA1358272.1 HdeD family acid-resistance protein [Glycomyces luteolus]
MLELLAKNWAWVLVRGIFTIVFGAVAVFWPGITLYVLIVLFGAYAIVDGVTAIVMGAKRSNGRGFFIFMGVVGVVAGLIALVWPGISALALLYVIAFWAIITGVGSIVSGFGLSRDAGGRWLFVISGLAGVVLGILLLVNPDEGAVALVVTIGFFAIIWGFFTVFTAVRLRRLAKELDARQDFTDI